MRIYADFNRATQSSVDPMLGSIDLLTMGSLKDLCRLQIRLTDGLALTIYSDSDEEHDLEADARARWQPSGNERGGFWTADYEPSAVREVPTQPYESTFYCFTCRADLSEQVKRRGVTWGHVCERCGTLVHAPILPPGAPLRPPD